MHFYFPGIVVALIGFVIFVITVHYCIDGIKSRKGENAAQTQIDNDECHDNLSFVSILNVQSSAEQLDLPPHFIELPPSYDDCNLDSSHRCNTHIFYNNNNR